MGARLETAVTFQTRSFGAPRWHTTKTTNRPTAWRARCQERSHVSNIGDVHPPSLHFSLHSFPPPFRLLIRSLHPLPTFFWLPLYFSLTSAIPLLPLLSLFRGPFPLKPARFVERCEHPAGPSRARPPNGLAAFWGENRPLVNDDSGVRWRGLQTTNFILQLQVTRYTNILGVSGIPAWIFLECPDSHDTHTAPLLVAVVQSPCRRHKKLSATYAGPFVIYRNSRHGRLSTFSCHRDSSISSALQSNRPAFSLRATQRVTCYDVIRHHFALRVDRRSIYPSRSQLWIPRERSGAEWVIATLIYWNIY